MVFKNFDDLPMVLKVEDLADTLEIGRNKAYALVSSRQIKALKLGNHYRIPRDEFVRFLCRETQQTA